MDASTSRNRRARSAWSRALSERFQTALMAPNSVGSSMMSIASTRNPEAVPASVDPSSQRRHGRTARDQNRDHHPSMNSVEERGPRSVVPRTAITVVEEVFRLLSKIRHPSTSPWWWHVAWRAPSRLRWSILARRARGASIRPWRMIRNRWALPVWLWRLRWLPSGPRH